MNAITERPALRHSPRDLATGYYAIGFTRWCYVARPDQRTGIQHRLGDIIQDGYFRDMACKIDEGDFIDVVAPDGGATLFITEVRHDPDMVRCAVMCAAMVPA